MRCLSCNGDKQVRATKSNDGTYTFGKSSCNACSGTGEQPLHMTLEQIEVEANTTVEIYCLGDECDYALNPDAGVKNYFRVAMDGGYVMYDGEDGMITCCPLCYEDKLQIEPID